MNRAIFLIALFSIGIPAHSQTTAMDCLPPLIPMTDVTPDLMRDFEGEIRQQFDDYFDQAQRYIACLDAANRTTNAEIREVLEAFRRLFPNG